nr:hypothetical protein BdHM001_36000 [Bdellovibrio sp. HM001]
MAGGVGISVKALSLPHPLSVGLEWRTWGDYLSLGAHKGFTPGFKVGEIGVQVDSVDVGLKYYPWAGTFYVGAVFGEQKVTGTTTDFVLGQRVEYKGEISSAYVTPAIGWTWTSKSGLFFNMELGWQISSGAKTVITTSEDDNALITSHPQYQGIKKDVEDIGNELGNRSLPSVGLINFGYLF